jgi:hypothetical protein
MDPIEPDLMMNEVDLDMNWDFDVGNKHEYTWDKSMSNTTEEFVPYHNFENPNSSYTWAFYEDSSDFYTSSKAPLDGSLGRRRGRRPIRPNLVGRKTEDLDKFWLRKFKAYVKKNPTLVLSNTKHPEFWNWIFSKSSDPGGSGMFKSFNRKYKQHLQKNSEFGEQFKLWYENDGRNQAFARFNEALATQYCEYVETELFKFFSLTLTTPESYLNGF